MCKASSRRDAPRTSEAHSIARSRAGRSPPTRPSEPAIAAGRSRRSSTRAKGYAALGRYGQAAGLLDRALKLAEDSPDRSQVPWILSRLGNILIATGPADAAETTLRRALEMAREGGDTSLTIAVLNDLGNFLATRRKAAEAVVVYRESAALAERAGDVPQSMRGRVNLARALRQSGDARGPGRPWTPCWLQPSRRPPLARRRCSSSASAWAIASSAGPALIPATSCCGAPAGL
jgi:tetratricopeptide (TPR) repeat protein